MMFLKTYCIEFMTQLVMVCITHFVRIYKQYSKSIHVDTDFNKQE